MSIITGRGPEKTVESCELHQNQRHFHYPIEIDKVVLGKSINLHKDHVIRLRH